MTTKEDIFVYTKTIRHNHCHLHITKRQDTDSLSHYIINNYRRAKKRHTNCLYYCTQ